MHPKIFNIQTGEIVDKAEDIYSGEQNSAILHSDLSKHPLLAFDKKRERLAIQRNENEVTVLIKE